jgi:fermentation-respiration switch protein FrsA (DUF1100 family)
MHNTDRNRSRGFTSRRFNFDVGGSQLVGVLRVPEDLDAPMPALVLDGPLTSVKEQAAGAYADALAARGFITLAFDHRHFGESQGEPRQYEHPGHKVEDIRGAVAALSALPEVDPARIGAVGICAGAGYMAPAVAEEHRIRAFATVAGFFHDTDQQRAWMKESFDTALETARAARKEYASTGVVRMIPAVGKEGDVAMPLAEAYAYYGTARGAVRNYTNAFAVMSREHTLPWDAQASARKIKVPTLMIHSEKALAPSLARKFFAGVRGPKEELWVESEGQIDFYDRPERIEPAADRMATHFRAHLT